MKGKRPSRNTGTALGRVAKLSRKGAGLFHGSRCSDSTSPLGWVVVSDSCRWARYQEDGSAGPALPGVGAIRDAEGYNNGDMVLNASEESLINVVRTLSPEEARKVLDWARQLGDLGRARVVEWSDSWSEEDLTDATAASLRRFDDQEREGR